MTNNANNTVVEFTPSQLAVTGSPTPAVTLSATADSVNKPSGLAFGSSGDLWVTNGGNNTVVEFTPAQLAASGSPTPAVTLSASAGSLAGPNTLAFDRGGDLWVENNANNTLVEFTPGQLGMSGASAPAVTLSATADSLDNAFSIAFGPSGALWVANSGNNTVVEFTPAQLAATGAPTPAVTLSAVGISLNAPDGLAFDSAGDLLVMNFPSNTVVEFTSSQLAATGAPTPAATLAATADTLDDPRAWPSTTRATCGRRTLTTTPWSSSARASSPTALRHAGRHPFGDDRLQPGPPRGAGLQRLWRPVGGELCQQHAGRVHPGPAGRHRHPHIAVTLSATGNSLDGLKALAFSSAGDLWVANDGNNSVVEFTPAQLAATGSPTPSITLASTAVNSLHRARKPGLQLRRRPVGGQRW